MSGNVTIRNHFVLGLFSLTLAGLVVKQAGARDKADSCGPLALMTCLRLLGESVEPDVCADLAGTTEHGDTTMAGLVKAARQLGHSALAMKLSERELAMLGRPVILHVSYPSAKEHFSVCASYQDEGFALINPTLGPGKEILTASQLHSLWDHKCIIFTESPVLDMIRVVLLRHSAGLAVLAGVAFGCGLAAISRNGARARRNMRVMALGVVILAGGSQIGFSDALQRKPAESLLLGMNVLYLGDIATGTPILRDTWYQNIGDGVLRIDPNRTKGSCSCLKVRAVDELLAQGEKGILRLHLGPKMRRGPFEHKVHLATQDRKGGKSLTIRGHIVGPGVAFPSRLYFGRVAPGTTPVRSFVYVAKHPRFTLRRIDASPSSVRCSVRQARPDSMKVDVCPQDLPPDGRFEGSVRLTIRDMEEFNVEVPFEGIVCPGTPEIPAANVVSNSEKNQRNSRASQ